MSDRPKITTIDLDRLTDILRAGEDYVEVTIGGVTFRAALDSMEIRGDGFNDYEVRVGLLTFRSRQKG